MFKLKESHLSTVEKLKREFGLTKSPLPTFQRNSSGREVIEYTPYGVRLFVSKEGRIELIAVIASEIRVKEKTRVLVTSRGISVGSPEKRMLERYVTKPYNLVDVQTGRIRYYDCIGFDVSNDTNVVRAILIYSARDKKQCDKER